MANRPADAGSKTVGPSIAGSAGPGPDSVDADRSGHAGALARGLAWLPYLIVLAGAAAGLYITWHGSRQAAARGTELVGCSLLLAAVFRLVLPRRYTAPMSSRRKASDVAAFALFGAGVLVVALLLP